MDLRADHPVEPNISRQTPERHRYSYGREHRQRIREGRVNATLTVNGTL